MTECTQEVVTSSGAKDTAADTADTASATCTLAETQAERDTLRRYAAAKCALAGYYLNVDNAKGMRVASARVNVTADDASAMRKAAVAVGLEEAFDKIRSRINGTSASSPSSSSSSLSSPNNNNKTSGAHPQFVHLPPGTLDDYRQTLLTSPCIRRDALSACLRQYCPENQVECGCLRFEEVVSACAAPGSPIFRVDGAASASGTSTSDSSSDASDSFMEGVRIRTVNNNTCSAARADKDREVLRRYTAAQCAIAGRPVLVTMDFFASTAPTVTVLNGTVPVNNRTAGGEPVDEPLPGSADATHGTMLSMVPVLAVVASLVM